MSNEQPEKHKCARCKGERVCRHYAKQTVGSKAQHVFVCIPCLADLGESVIARNISRIVNKGYGTANDMIKRAARKII